jgi:predicted nucleic-acid-binding Zn-ribbon protein
MDNDKLFLIKKIECETNEVSSEEEKKIDYDKLKIHCGCHSFEQKKANNLNDTSFTKLIEILINKFTNIRKDDILIKCGKKYAFITKKEADETLKIYKIINREDIIKNRDALKELLNCLVDDLTDNEIK